MNDKIKDLIDKAYKTDSIEKNKWRIENREQLREQRKKELKELMEKEITMDSGSVQWFFDQLVANRIIVINGSTYWDKVKAKHEMLLEQAKKMEKEKIETAYNKGTVHGIDYPESTLPLTGEQYYNETYGGGKQ
jgi:hypothetical protein